MAVVGGCKPVLVACVSLWAFCNHLVRLMRDLLRMLHLPIIISHHLVIILLPWHLFTILWPSGQHLLCGDTHFGGGLILYTILQLYTILHIVMIYFRLILLLWFCLLVFVVVVFMCEMTMQFPIMGWLKYSVFGEHFVNNIEKKISG